MIKRKRLGQHFLNSDPIAESICSEAKVNKNDTVFELGTGLGILTPMLCNKAKKVISIDTDDELYQNANNRFGKIENLELKLGDGFKSKDEFTVFVSNLPYSKSRDAIEWLAQKNFSHGVIMVQKEFADKLFATTKDRRAISVIANYAMDFEKISRVSKNNFDPPPNVDSVILRIVKKKIMDKKLIQAINRIFSYRRKTLTNIYRQFGKETTINKRLDDLSGDEIVAIAKEIL